MINYGDITIIIPVRVDSEQRADNLDKVIAYLRQFEGVEIIVIESDEFQKVKEYAGVRRMFVEERTPIFHRTRLGNVAAGESAREYIGIWDADIIVDAANIAEAMQLLRTDQADVVIPYDGRAINKMSENDSGNVMFGHFSVGGLFLMKRSVYWSVGGENERIVGWGPEDIERVKRWEILGLRVARLDGILTHFHHSRAAVNYEESYKRKLENEREFLKVCRMNRDTLQKYITDERYLNTDL